MPSFDIKKNLKLLSNISFFVSNKIYVRCLLGKINEFWYVNKNFEIIYAKTLAIIIIYNFILQQ